MGLYGIEDHEIFPSLKDRGVELLITGDLAQVGIPQERAGLIDANLHWLGVPQSRAAGVTVIAQVLSIVIPGVGHVLEDWPDAPTAYYLREPPDSPIATSFAL